MLLTRMAVAVGAAAAFVLLPATAASAAPSEQDTAFLQAAHQSNLAEIAGGEIAQQKGQSQEVKDLGARFIEDHTRLDSALQDTAEALGVELPSAPNAEQRALAQRYEATDGADFDALYVSTQMDAHMKAMRLGQTEIAEGSDADAKKIAQDSAPVIASHHELLEDAGAAIGVPTGVDTGTGGLAADNGSPAMIGFGVLGVLLVGTALLVLRRRRIPAGQD